MTACELCWSNAYFLSRIKDRSHVDIYHELVTQHAICPDVPVMPTLDEAGVT